jgi:hypothetical protein
MLPLLFFALFQYIDAEAKMTYSNVCENPQICRTFSTLILGTGMLCCRQHFSYWFHLLIVCVLFIHLFALGNLPFSFLSFLSSEDIDHLGKVDEQTTIDVLNEAVRLGINTFDTAPIYVNSEYRLGNWLRYD